MSAQIGLDLQQIEERAIEQVFERGYSLFQRRAIFLPVQRGNVISAQCVGRQSAFYHVSAAFDEAGECTTECDCPYDWDGDCKHIVALLLTYLYEPELFRAGAAIREELMSLSKEDLADIVEQMATRYLGLEDIIETKIKETRKDR